jgi:hypothetical protein
VRGCHTSCTLLLHADGSTPDAWQGPSAAGTAAAAAAAADANGGLSLAATWTHMSVIHRSSQQQLAHGTAYLSSPAAAAVAAGSYCVMYTSFAGGMLPFVAAALSRVVGHATTGWCLACSRRQCCCRQQQEVQLPATAGGTAVSAVNSNRGQLSVGARCWKLCLQQLCVTCT